MYLLFMWNEYYPSGGFNDFKGRFDKIEDARRLFNDDYEHYQIVDLTTFDVEEGKLGWLRDQELLKGA